MKRILIFETNAGDGGHHIEYLHHLYMEACRRKDLDFTFVVPRLFEQSKTRFDWPEAQNVIFDYIDDSILDKLSLRGHLARFWGETRLIRKYVINYRVDLVFLSSLINYILYLPLLMPRGVQVSGIIYNIYLYSWREMTLIKKMSHVVANMLMAKSHTFKKIFILNDSSAAAYLNKLYKTKKYEYIPDPIMPIGEEIVNIRKMLNISNDSVVFVQCGNQNRRKMPLEILNSIISLNETQGLTFVIAGKVNPAIRDDFYQIVDKIGSKHHVIVKDEHLDYNFMSALIQSANYLFLLYDNNSQSSGFMGHAALHHTPIIVRNEGLLGKLARRYHLGLFVESNDNSDISHVIIYCQKNRCLVDTSKYVVTHTPELFSGKLFA